MAILILLLFASAGVITWLLLALGARDNKLVRQAQESNHTIGVLRGEVEGLRQQVIALCDGRPNCAPILGPVMGPAGSPGPTGRAATSGASAPVQGSRSTTTTTRPPSSPPSTTTSTTASCLVRNPVTGRCLA